MSLQIRHVLRFLRSPNQLDMARLSHSKSEMVQCNKNFRSRLFRTSHWTRTYQSFTTTTTTTKRSHLLSARFVTKRRFSSLPEPSSSPSFTNITSSSHVMNQNEENDDHNNSISSSTMTDRDEFMKEIRQATHDNIHTILASDERLQTKWNALLERIHDERSRVGMKKSNQRVRSSRDGEKERTDTRQSETPNQSTFRTSSGAAATAASTVPPSLMDLLDDVDGEHQEESPFSSLIPKVESEQKPYSSLPLQQQQQQQPSKSLLDLLDDDDGERNGIFSSFPSDRSSSRVDGFNNEESTDHEPAASSEDDSSFALSSTAAAALPSSSSSLMDLLEPTSETDDDTLSSSSSTHENDISDNNNNNNTTFDASLQQQSSYSSSSQDSHSFSSPLERFLNQANDEQGPSETLSSSRSLKDGDIFDTNNLLQSNQNAQDGRKAQSLMDLLNDDDDDDDDTTPTSLTDNTFMGQDFPLTEGTSSQDWNSGEMSAQETSISSSSTSSTSEGVTYRDLLSEGIALLSSMSERDWRLLDRVVSIVTEDDDHDDNGDGVVQDDIIGDKFGMDRNDDDDDGFDNVEEEEVIDFDDHLEMKADNQDKVITNTDAKIDPDADSIDKNDELMEKMEDFLVDLLNGNVFLSTEEYNQVLLFLASTPAYTCDDAVDMIRKVYTHISAPNGFTHAIVVPALSKRGHAIAASQIIKDMMMEDYVFDNQEAMIQAMLCLEICKEHQQMEQLIRHILNIQEERTVIPVHAITPLMRLYVSNNMTNEAMDLIDDYMLEVGNSTFPKELVLLAIKWPRRHSKRDRSGVQTLQTFIFNKVKEMDRSLSRDQRFVAQRFAAELFDSAPRKETSFESGLVQEILWLLLKADKYYYPNPQMLKAGLEVAARHRDPKVTVQLLQRLHDKHMNDKHRVYYGEEKEQAHRPVIPLQAFELAMHVCVSASDTDSIHSILTFLDQHADAPDVLKRQLMNHAVIGFANASEWTQAFLTLSTMCERGLTPTDEAFGLVIHSLAAAKRANEALDLFDRLASGDFGGDSVKPGLSSYNGKMFALMSLKKWQEAIDLHHEMKEIGLPSSSVAYQGVFLASMRLGDKDSVIDAVEGAIQSNVSLNAKCFEQAFKCLLPDLVGDENDSGGLPIPEIRVQLRKRMDATKYDTGVEDKKIRKAYLDLSKSMRAAEMEEGRRSSAHLGQDKIDDRRHAAWKAAHTALVQLYRLQK